MKRAVIDIGTNSVLLLIAEQDTNGCLNAITDQAKTARLGEGLAATGQLNETAMARTIAILQDYAKAIQTVGISDVICFGTAALRRAQNAQDFIQQVQQQLGWTVQVLSGEEEARYAFAGALSAVTAVSAAAADSAVVIDIGGGSTEVVYGSRSQGVTSEQSFPIGAVTLKDQLNLPSQLDDVDCNRALAHLSDTFNNLPPASNASLLFTGGTATTLPALEKQLTTYDIDQIEGTQLTAAKIQSLYDRLNNLNLEARSQLPGMEPGRADIILPALLILQALLNQFWPNNPPLLSLTCTARGARYGILLPRSRATTLPNNSINTTRNR